MRRTNSAIGRAAGAREVIQAVLSDSEPHGAVTDIAFNAPGLVAALGMTYRLAEDIRTAGPDEVIRRISESERVEASLPGILLGLARMAARSAPSPPKPSILDEIARRALIATASSVLQGSHKDISMSKKALERNLASAVNQLGTTGLMSLFLGNYLADLTLFYVGRRLNTQLSAKDQVKAINRRREFEHDVRRRSKEIGNEIAKQLIAQIPAKSYRVTDYDSLARQLSQVIPDAISKLAEESN
jgi:hypothetical protein